LVALVGVVPGQRALDVGCGSGAVAEALAALLGPDSVAGVDPAEASVTSCRERVPGADMRVGRAEELPLETARSTSRSRSWWCPG
jgi:ubiquinone/menaquinone biosynthesis C-methylase UbiE